MMDWMLMPLKRYADFSGRSCRQEYWMFYLFNILVVIAFMLLFALVGGFSGGSEGMGTFAGIIGGVLLLGWLALFFIPSIAVTVRRLHDQDKSGWFILINFIPYIGGIVVFVFMCLKGTAGPNRFGDDPLGGEKLGEIFS
jgi:uncharacterized membrane protein YhaH (DUF805 family)